MHPPYLLDHEALASTEKQLNEKHQRTVETLNAKFQKEACSLRTLYIYLSPSFTPTLSLHLFPVKSSIPFWCSTLMISPTVSKSTRRRGGASLHYTGKNPNLWRGVGSRGGQVQRPPFAGRRCPKDHRAGTHSERPGTPPCVRWMEMDVGKEI